MHDSQFFQVTDGSFLIHFTDATNYVLVIAIEQA